jgi:hypothetical protein
VFVDVDEVPVVEAGATDGVFVGAESEFPDQVKGALGCGAKACDVSGIWRDFRLYQNDVECARDPLGADAVPGAEVHAFGACHVLRSGTTAGREA